MAYDAASGPDVVLGVAAVARRLGVAPGTLRTWDRRYGIGPSGHQAGARRRYSAEDLARLEVMHRLMLEGVAPADSARAALSAVAPTASPEPATDPAGRAGGGHIIAVRDASPATRGLARAAMALNSDACAAMIATSLTERGVLAAWEELLLPVLGGVGERWRATGSGIDVEHLLSECIEDCLRAVTRTLAQTSGPRPRNTRPVLLAALEGEHHRLPLHALAAGLADRSISVRMLGPGLPASALADAMARTGPAVVFLWAQLPDERLGQRVAALPTLRPAARVVLGGPGWLGAITVPRGHWVPDLRGAVEAVVRAAVS